MRKDEEDLLVLIAHEAFGLRDGKSTERINIVNDGAQNADVILPRHHPTLQFLLEGGGQG